MRRLILILLLISNNCYAGWECINRNGLIPTCNTWRWKVPHGWLISVDNDDHGASVTFYPDENHEWGI
jgi:hypothetical protein